MRPPLAVMFATQSTDAPVDDSADGLPELVAAGPARLDATYPDDTSDAQPR